MTNGNHPGNQNPLAQQWGSAPRPPQQPVGNPLQGQPPAGGGKPRVVHANPMGGAAPSAVGGHERHGQYPLHADLHGHGHGHGGGASSGPQHGTDDVPWVVETRLRPGEQIQRSTLWGILTVVAAGLHLLVAAVGTLQAMFIDVSAFYAILPFWGILSLVVLAGVIMCFIQRGSFNRWMAIIAAGTLVISNPVGPMAVAEMML